MCRPGLMSDDFCGAAFLPPRVTTQSRSGRRRGTAGRLTGTASTRSSVDWIHGTGPLIHRSRRDSRGGLPARPSQREGSARRPLPGGAIALMGLVPQRRRETRPGVGGHDPEQPRRRRCQGRSRESPARSRFIGYGRPITRVDALRCWSSSSSSSLATVPGAAAVFRWPSSPVAALASW
jgi:hypothetical protein